ncbi:polysaccharide deacetylase [Bradyrhizobiaceae bacterium SG-6C]|nr:polysaccharide deacetylase [Bradyrhizobiaceae bacterium SG-6C]
MDTEHYGKDLRYGAFDFLDDAGSLGFVTEVDSPDANLEFRVWKAGATASQPRFKITAGFLDDIISIRPDLGYLYILKASGVHRFALETGKAATENPLTESFDPEAVTLSDDAQVLALAEGRTIAIVDTTSGGVIKMHEAPAPVSDYCTDDCRIKHLAFIPGTRTLIYADDDGAINALDIAMGTQRSIYTTKSNHNKSIDAFALSANGRYLAFAQNDVAYVMDVATKATAVRFAISKAGGMYGIILAFVDDDRRLLVGGRELDIFDIGQQSKVLNYKSTIFVDRTRYYNASVKYVVPTKFLNDSWIIGIAGNPGGQMLAYRDGRIVRHFGSGRPSTTYLTGQAGTAVDFSSTQMIVGRGTDIRVTDASFQTWERVSSHPAEVKFLARLKSGNLLSVSKNGEIRIGLGASSTDLVRTSLYGDGHWVAVSPEGFFAGTDQALRKLYIRSGGSDIVPLDNLYQSLYRPDLIREKLAGDPQGKVGLASTRLDLAKIIESGAAPKVSISLAEGGQVSTTDEVEIRAKIVAQGGGIGKVEWRVNGITLGLESRGFERLTGGSQETVVSRKLSLDPGENKIEVVAYNARDLIASDAAQTLIRWDGQNTAAPPTLYVLAVGVNDYFDGRLRLSYAVPDAKALAEGLVKTGAGLYSDVHVTRVLDADVTREKLDKAFTEIGSKVKARDVFVFFLAGHGKTKNGKYYFLPRDFRYEDENSIERSGINQDQFQGWFSKVAARKSILLYDTCESGSLTSANATRGDIDERLGALNRMTRATGRTFLVATTDDAPAIEGYKGHGVFTYALLDAMERGDVNGNGLIEISELADYVDAKVPDYSFEAFKMRQVPQRNIVGSNFALANRGAVLGAVGADQKAAAPFPTKATHVVISNVISRSEADDAAQTTMSLSPGMQVRVIETTGGWALVAREGRRIGYVQQRDLVALQ